MGTAAPVAMQQGVKPIDLCWIGLAVASRTANFVTRSTHTVMSDPLYLVGTMPILGDSFTVGTSGSMTLTNLLPNWSATNSPSLRYFTNLGVITVENRANYGSDTATPYKAFVNNENFRRAMYYGIDRVYVLDSTGQPIHAMRDGSTLTVVPTEFGRVGGLSNADGFHGRGE